MKHVVIASMKARPCRREEFPSGYYYSVSYRARPKFDATVCADIPLDHLRETIAETLLGSGKHLCEIERDMAGYRRTILELKRKRGF